ncbi:hypothetical protein ACFL09_03745 [Planctomycetota bacterium]
MYFLKLNKTTLTILFVFCYPIGAWELWEYLVILRAQSHPVVEGTVITREEFRRCGGIPAGKFTIEIDETGETVVARTSAHVLAKMPDRVRFHYTGDPAKEVFLQGEGNPIWIALIMLGGPIILLMFYLYRNEGVEAQSSPPRSGRA